MAEYLIHDVELEVTHDKVSSEQGLSAVAIPAEQAQIAALGRVVIGNAWSLSSHLDDGPRCIKFAPPDSQTPDFDTQLSNCFRGVLRVADRLELPSVAIVLPYEEAQAIEVACASIVSGLQACQHLVQLRLVVESASQEAQCVEALAQAA